MMRSFSILVTFACVIMRVCACTAQADEGHNFAGAKGCKMCHMSAGIGAQYKSWEESMHSKAYETLGAAQPMQSRFFFAKDLDSFERNGYPEVF